MHEDIITYHKALSEKDKEICEILYKEINNGLIQAENKVWHGHPVWFLEGNPIVGYSKQKAGIKLMFWSGASFDDTDLQLGSGKFKDAAIFYTDKAQIDQKKLNIWLQKAEAIQWDYKNIVKRKGVLERLK